MYRHLISAIALAALTAAPAFAADMALKAPPPAPTPLYSWSGCYVGLNAGYQWGSGNSNLELEPSLAAWTAIDPAYGNFAGRYAWSPSSGAVGGQAGCNWQSGILVAGIETDIDYLGASHTASLTGPVAGQIATATLTQKLDWLGTTRGRLGITAGNNWLLYATGGVAYGETRFSNSFVNNFNVGFAGSSSQTRAGWTVGAGAEFLIAPSWTVKAEYLYYNLGNTRVVGVPFNQSPNGFGADGVYQTSGNILRVGLNYKFGGPHP
jgi:outer membrane immunogenic protein